MIKLVSFLILLLYSFSGSSFVHALFMGFVTDNIDVVPSCHSIVSQNFDKSDLNTDIKCYTDYEQQNISQGLLSFLDIKNLIYSIQFDSIPIDYIIVDLVGNKSPPIYRNNVKLNNFSDLVGIVKISIY